MKRPPYLARVAAGVAATVVEETRRLPTHALTLPMTSVSKVLQTSMRVQQTMTQLAIKGDQALSFLYPLPEQPEWAVFDEDLSGTEEPDTAAGPGRFALYSTPPEAALVEAEPVADADPGAPEVVATLGYDALTLAQLRPRLASLTQGQVEALLAYERSHGARSPFLTMLENRLSALAAK